MAWRLEPWRVGPQEAVPDGIGLAGTCNVSHTTVVNRSFADAVTERLFREDPMSGALASVQGGGPAQAGPTGCSSSADGPELAAGNRLEALKGDRKGQYSIRVNDQWRVCFRWTPDGPVEVEIVDYH